MKDEILKCDARSCGHIEKVGTITAKMVDMTCSSCGSNLLTLEDWNGWKLYSALISAVEQLAPEDDDGPKVSMRVGLHGKKTTIEIERQN